MKRFLLSFWNHRRRNLVLVILALIGLLLLNPYFRQSIFGPTIEGIPWCVWEAEIRERFHRHDEKSWFRTLLETFGASERSGNLALKNTSEFQPLFRHLADDDDVQVRNYALNGLVDKADPDNLPIFKAHLQDDDLRCRLTAVRGLLEITHERDLKTVVLPLIGHSEQMIHREASLILCEMARTDPDLLDPISALAADSDYLIKWWAVRSMRYFGQRGVPILRQALHDPDKQVREQAISTTMALGKDGLELLPILESLQNDADPDTRRSAALALFKMDPKQFPKPPD